MHYTASSQRLARENLVIVVAVLICTTHVYLCSKSFALLKTDYHATVQLMAADLAGS